MEKRLILAVALSILVIVTFQHFFPTKPAEQAIEKTTVVAPIKESAIQTPPPPLAPLLEEHESVITTNRFTVTFSNIGGAIKRIQLNNYTKLNSQEPLELVSIKDPKEYIGTINDPQRLLPLDISTYESTQTDNQVTYSLTLKDFQITKQYIFHKSSNNIELQIQIHNKSNAVKQFSYRIIGGSGIVEEHPQDQRLIEVFSKVDGKTVGFKRPKNNEIKNPGIVEWVALKNRYFSVILKPLTQTQGEFHTATKDDGIVSGIDVAAITIPQQSFTENKFIVYAGPSKASELKKAGLEDTINYGFFGAISKAILAVLGLFYRVIHNWGISIILLSIFLNILLFPLTFKSFKSLQSMHKIHPLMEKLKTQYKDNPQKLHQETMELYKKYKINPLGGCLPFFLQIPIFFALYQALTKSIALRSESFFWIKNLSMPDAVGIPFSLPLIGNSIHILPLATVLLMVIQQQLSTKMMGGAVTEEQKQQQQMMLVVMPVMIGFAFYNMPSGMVLYWFVNTILTIIEQSVVFNPAKSD